MKAKARDELGFAAFVGEYLAGCVFIKEKADHFYLGKLAVAPAFEGQGIGRQLLEKAEHQAVVRSSAHFDLIESDRRSKCLF